MTKKKNPRARRFTALLICLSLLPLAFLPFFAGGCAPRSDVEELQARNRALEKRAAELERELRAERARGQEETVTLYLVRQTENDFWLVPEVRKIRRQPNMLKAALEEFIRSPANPIPKETRVIDVTVKDFVAYPDFSQEITRMSVGSKGEALVVTAIANTLIKFPGVEKVQILVNGRKVESLAGHVDVSQPVGRSDEFLLLEQ